MLRVCSDLKDFDAGELAKLVANQVSVGSMVKNDESGKEQPLGFISAINMHRYKDKKCIKQIKSYFLSHCGGEANQKKLKALFDDTSKPLGLVLQDRVINMPQQLVPPLHQALMDDIEWAVKDDQESEKVRKTFDFQNFLMLGKCFYAEDRDNQLKDPSDNAGKKKKKRAKTAGKQETEYFRFEEEYYEKVSLGNPLFTPLPISLYIYI